MSIKSDLVLGIFFIIAFLFIIKEYLFGSQRKINMQSIKSLEKRTGRKI